MKRKLMLLSTLILVSILVAGGTMAWFTDNKSIVIKLQVKQLIMGQHPAVDSVVIDWKLKL